MVNSESIVGQSALTIAFFASIDFSKVLSLKSLAERERAIRALWSKFVNAVDVTPEQVADAMLLSRTALIEQKRTDLVVIQDRIFKMFRSRNDTFVNDYREQQRLWNSFLASRGKDFGFDSKERRQAAFKLILEKVKTFESFDALAATLSGHFMLPDPDRIYGASGGLGPNSGSPVRIPSNTIIHATARRAVLAEGQWQEDLGLSSLHQVYFVNPLQAGSVAARLLKPENNPLMPEATDVAPVIPAERRIHR